jgi:hypothetical protein
MLTESGNMHNEGYLSKDKVISCWDPVIKRGDPIIKRGGNINWFNTATYFTCPNLGPDIGTSYVQKEDGTCHVLIESLNSGGHQFYQYQQNE